MQHMVLIYRRFSSYINKSRINIMDLNKCYFRHLPDEDKVEITFTLKVKDKVRQFNFSRKSAETLETLSTRLATNVKNKIVTKKRKKNASETDTVITATFYNKMLPISVESLCIDLFNLEGPVKLSILDTEFTVVFNVPWVVSVNLPSCILAGYTVYPENYVTMYSTAKDTIFKWYKGACDNVKENEIQNNNIKWEFICCNSNYTPNVKDIGMKLKLECIPGNNETIGPAFEVFSKQAVEAGPGRCPFETRHSFTNKKLENKSFRCVSYNILADLYCDSDFTRTALHPYCPPYALDINYRKQLILKEILGYNADIICLQEVDRKIFMHYLQPHLQSAGLEGTFCKKGKEVAEGLACFYQKERFRLLDQTDILLSKAIQRKSSLKSLWEAVKENRPLVERFLDRSTVVSATILKSLDNPNEIIVVGNTHLYFHPDADHIRLLQGAVLIKWLKEVTNDIKLKNPDDKISLILCGDFNSVPSCGIYQLYTTGKVPSDLPDWKSNENEAVENISLSQDILLASACGTPKFTNYTSGFADCLDYIFYETSKLKVEQIIPFPSEEELQAHTALPSIVFPSDHIAIISDLQFI